MPVIFVLLFLCQTQLYILHILYVLFMSALPLCMFQLVSNNTAELILLVSISFDLHVLYYEPLYLHLTV